MQPTKLNSTQLFLLQMFSRQTDEQRTKEMKEVLSAIHSLCLAYDVATMYVFGSACTDKFSENSDIDILVSFKDISIEKYTDNYFNLHDELEKLFGRKIDLVTEKSLSNPYFIASIEETKRLLYAA